MKRLLLVLACLSWCACAQAAWYGGNGEQEVDATSVGGTAAADMATDAEVAAADIAATNAAVVDATNLAITAALAADIAPPVTNLFDCGDVTGSPAVGDMLRYTAAGWTNAAGYVSFGDGAYTYTNAELTVDSAFHDLYLTNKIPTYDTNATAVHVTVFGEDDSTSGFVQIRPGGWSSTTPLTVRSQVANAYNDGFAVIPIGSDGVLQYLVSTGYDTVRIVILGYEY